MRGSCSVAMASPVQRHDVHITCARFPEASVGRPAGPSGGVANAGRGKGRGAAVGAARLSAAAARQAHALRPVGGDEAALGRALRAAQVPGPRAVHAALVRVLLRAGARGTGCPQRSACVRGPSRRRGSACGRASRLDVVDLDDEQRGDHPHRAAGEGGDDRIHLNSGRWEAGPAAVKRGGSGRAPKPAGERGTRACAPARRCWGARRSG